MSVTRRMFDARGNAIAATVRVYDDHQQPEISDRLHWITADDPPQFVVDRIVVEMHDGTREFWTRGPEWCQLCDMHRDDVPCPHAAGFRDVCDALVQFVVSTMNVTDEHEHDRGACPIDWAGYDEIEIMAEQGDAFVTGTLIEARSMS